jgi:predicted Zn-dependent protease
LALEPGSPVFVALAEEYRRSGRLSEALAVLQRGLARRPGYISAQVALGRVLLEMGRTDEAISMFSNALSADPGNLVSARSLAEIYLSRGEKVEAIKKYKLYRGLSGDRRVDGVIERLGRELAAGLEVPMAAPEPPRSDSPGVPASEAASPGSAAPRRQARITALKRWLSVVQTR